MSTRGEIAELIFPEVQETIADLQNKYPPRNEKVVSRFSPSPTGFLHIGGLYTSFVAWKYAKQNQGIYFLRIEDTDQKREMEGAIGLIIKYLKRFGIEIDEGPLGDDNEDRGQYGPYTQSQRKSLYQVFVKALITKGLAYPCWMTEAELESIRDMQTKTKVTPGIYGQYSVRRNKTPEEIVEKIKQDPNFVIRFRSHGDLTKRVIFDDIVREKVNMIDNYNDIVLIKSDGLPTYHMAHIVDDTLMRTTHVIRGEEWLTSVPLHLQLFAACELPAPHYAHLAPLLKLEDGNKRKLSKRKDPEADVGYFFEHGYAKQGVIEYLLTIIDPFFEEWQKNNPDKNYLNYDITLERMNKAGALFDLTKLQSVNNNYLSRISTQQLYEESLEWAKTYKPEVAQYMETQREYAISALDIERHTPKDPKRFTTFADVEQQLLFFYDTEWQKMFASKPALPEMITPEIKKAFAEEYIQTMKLDGTVEEWFAQLKEIAKKYGFAGNNAEFKEGGYIGKIGDIAMFLRIQLCAATQTPDLFSMMKIMGSERIQKRLLA